MDNERCCSISKNWQEMERFDWKRTIRANILVLRVVGVWPPDDEEYGCNLYTAYKITNFLFLQASILFFQTAFLLLNLIDLQAVTGTIFVLLMEMLAPLKSYSLFRNMKMLKQLMITINSDLFQPKNAQQRSLIQPTLDAWKKIVSAYWFFTLSWLFLLMLSPIFDERVEYRLPFLAWYPYNTKTSPQFELTYLHQFVAVTTISITNISIDSLIAALNMYIGAQFEILCDDLRNFYDAGKDSRDEVKERLKNCVHHHREILKFAQNANKFYNMTILEEFFAGAICIGLSMFQLTVVPPFSSEFHSFISYANAISVQVFMYCWFGNEIELKSTKLPYAIFESDWTSLPQEVKQEMIIFLIRTQRPLKMSAFGLFYLSLETFVRILRTAWSYFALLRQVNLRKQNSQ
ncbi:7tm 6 domain containing protein, partial [Asbolus verrucosus]